MGSLIMVKLIKDYARHQVRKYPYLRHYVKKFQRQLEKVDSAKTYYFKALQCLDSVDLDYTQQKYEKPQNSLIEITNACNLNCLMCNTKLSKHSPSLMTSETFERIIIELKSVGINTAGLKRKHEWTHSTIFTKVQAIGQRHTTATHTHHESTQSQA